MLLLLLQRRLPRKDSKLLVLLYVLQLSMHKAA
jgi:hypothetical protein